MRIGIMTFWWSQDNYGQLLQCYALQKYFRELGHDAFVIRNHLQISGGIKSKLKKYLLHPWLVLKGVKRVYWRRKGAAENVAFNRHFDEFRKNRIKWSPEEYFTFSALRQNPPNAEMYVVGSDQVWNIPGLEYEDNLKAYFLQFGSNNVARVAYAPSFGASELSSASIARLSSWLQQFASVSCREQSGVEMCAQCGVHASWVEDPTLLLPPEHWKSLAIDPNRSKPYVFVYLLSWKSNVSMQVISQWAAHKGLQVVYVKGNRGTKTEFNDDDALEANPTIEEWLGLVQHASCVITNSFHCSVFSTLFGRHLYVSLLGGKAASSNNRIADLCARTENTMTLLKDDLLAGLYDCGEMSLPSILGEDGRAFLAEVLKNGVPRT